MRYNHSHDQLLLTGSSDSRVILSNMVSISSEPFGHLVDDDELSDNEESQQEDKYTSLSVSLTFHVSFTVSSDFLYKCDKIHLCPWSTKAVLSLWGIFVEIAKNTLYGSKLYIFILCQKSLGY